MSHVSVDRLPMEHDLKVWPDFYRPLARGDKTFEIRKFDRDFRVGDILWLREWQSAVPAENPNKGYTGNVVHFRITYILSDVDSGGLMPGYAILGLGPVAPLRSPAQEAIEDACTVLHIGLTKETPAEAINKLIGWHIAVALDPTVSEEASKLRGDGEKAAQLLETMRVHKLGIYPEFHAESWNVVKHGINGEEIMLASGQTIEDAFDRAKPVLDAGDALHLSNCVKDALDDECYSAENEIFRADLAEILEGKQPGDSFWIGKSKHPMPGDYFNASWLLEDAGERAGDDAGESAEDFPDVTMEQALSLDATLKLWANRNLKCNFFTVSDIVEHKATVELLDEHVPEWREE